MKGRSPDRESLVREGMEVSGSDMYSEDRIWSLHSSDKVDISEVLMGVVRHLHRTLPPDRSMRALSVGSGSEPQFQILQAAFAGGLYLLDIDDIPLAVVRKDLKNRCIENVRTLLGDYSILLGTGEACREFREKDLGGERMDLVTLHHSLYYSDVSSWNALLRNIAEEILTDRGSVHAVLMSPDCSRKNSTAWLYSRFAGEFFGRTDDQDLAAFGREIADEPWLQRARVEVETREVRFRADSFRQLMSVVWMILLYPTPNDFDEDQKREITEYVYDTIWSGREPLIQLQDHLVIRSRTPLRS